MKQTTLNLPDTRNAQELAAGDAVSKHDAMLKECRQIAKTANLTFAVRGGRYMIWRNGRFVGRTKDLDNLRSTLKRLARCQTSKPMPF